MLFLLIALYWFRISVWACFPLALMCGILGGWGYLYSVYRLLDQKKISKRNREFLANWLMLFANIGAIVATGFVFVMNYTFLHL